MGIQYMSELFMHKIIFMYVREYNFASNFELKYKILLKYLRKSQNISIFAWIWNVLTQKFYLEL